jgi:hypothetical protein
VAKDDGGGRASYLCRAQNINRAPHNLVHRARGCWPSCISDTNKAQKTAMLSIFASSRRLNLTKMKVCAEQTSVKNHTNGKNVAGKRKSARVKCKKNKGNRLLCHLIAFSIGQLVAQFLEFTANFHTLGDESSGRITK